jgi:hypothetical protein
MFTVRLVVLDEPVDRETVPLPFVTLMSFALTVKVVDVDTTGTVIVTWPLPLVVP